MCNTVGVSVSVNWILIADMLCKILKPRRDYEFVIIVNKSLDIFLVDELG